MIRRILFIAICLLGLSGGAAGFMLLTEKGLQVSTALLEKLSGGRLDIGSSTGRILGDWRLGKITIHADAVDIVIDDLRCSWQPKQLSRSVIHAGELSFTGVQIILKSQAAGGRAAGAAPFALPEISFPLSLLIGSLRIDQLEIKQLGGENLFTLHTFSARLSGTTSRLVLSEAIFRSSAKGAVLSGTAAGELQMAGSWPVEITGGWQLKAAGCSELGGRLQVSESLNDPLIELQVTSPVTVDGRLSLSKLFTARSYQVDLGGTGVVPGAVCDSWPDVAVDLELQAGGEAGEAAGVLRAAVVTDDSAPLTVELDFTMDGRRLTLNNGTVGYDENQVGISAGITFGPELSWDGVLTVDSFDVSRLAPLPATSLDTRVNFSGRVIDGEVFYTGSVEQIEISAAEFDLLLHGGLAVDGNLQGLEIASCRFKCGEGAVDLAGSLSWADGLRWQADVRLESFDPSEIDGLPTGSISGSLTSEGSYRDGDLRLVTKINTLTGTLSGYELSGGGSLIYQDRVLLLNGVDIANGGNRLTAAGRIDEHVVLEFTLEAAELERLFPDLGGNLEISGTVEGPRAEPTAHIVLDGRDMRYQGYAAGGVSAEIDADLAGRAVNGSLQLDRLDLSGFGVSAVKLAVDGTMEKHRLSGVLELERGRLEAAMNGTVQDNVWKAQVSRTIYDDQRFGAWRQSGSAHLVLSADGVAADNLCIDSGQNRACVQAAWEQSGIWSLSVDELFFSMASLNQWGVLDKEITGTLTAALQVSGSGAVIDSGTGRASIDKLGLILGPNAYYDDLVWSGTSLHFTVEDTNLDGRLASSLVDGSYLNGIVSLAGAGDSSKWNSTMELGGNVDVHIIDLAFLQTLTGDFLLPSGNLSGNVDIGGTLGQPSAAGSVELGDGELRIPLLGIHLKEVAGTIEAGFDKLALELDSRSGNGTLRSSGVFEFGSGAWNGRLTISGRDSLLLDRRAITMTADPELDLTLDGDGGNLSGKVVVTDALIEVEKIDRSASESSDVVFVDRFEETAPWPFRYNIEVVLGDAVKVVGHGLNGKLGGHLIVANNPDGSTVGRGYLDIVDGSFTVYGSPLRISRGRLSFDGGPVDNPGLDIRASKFIEETRFGYDGVEAGVNVTGSADDFVMDLFSVPGMEEADILAYILLDKPLSSEGARGSEGFINSAVQAIGLGKGSDLLTDVSSMLPVDDIRVEGSIESQETSVVVGKRLSKDLSVSYDYNLFKNAGSFRVRYDFGKGFSVESRNSLDSNGVELLYSLER